MIWNWEIYQDHFHLLPALAISRVKCDHCDETHGWTLDFCFLMFGCSIGFETGGGEE